MDNTIDDPEQKTLELSPHAQSVGTSFSLQHARICAAPDLLRLFDEFRWALRSIGLEAVNLMEIFDDHASRQRATANASMRLRSFTDAVITQVRQHIHDQIAHIELGCATDGVINLHTYPRPPSYWDSTIPSATILHFPSGSMVHPVTHSLVVAAEGAPRRTKAEWFTWFQEQYGHEVMARYVASVQRAHGKSIQPSQEAVMRAVHIAFTRRIRMTYAGDVYFADKPLEIIGTCTEM